MKIVVVGGVGFVGTNLCLHFLEKGNKVIAADNLFKKLGSYSNKKLIESKGGRFEYLDIRNANDVDIFFKKEKNIDVIINMAAQVAFKVSVENPRLDFEINALGTFNLLESIRLYHSNAIFICASTNQVYGRVHEELEELEKRYDFKNLKTGIPETYTLDFLSPYGCSKGTADQYTLDYARIYNLKTVVTRFGGIYGQYQYSYEDHGWVSFMTEMVLKDKEFNRFGNGKQVRDILYVSDIVRAIEKCIENIDEVKGEAINIAGGAQNTSSILELLNLLEKLTGNKEKSIVHDMRTGDKKVAYLDISKAKRLLNWEPQISIEMGVKKLIDWMGTDEFKKGK